jgi:hypothetical protein
VPIVPADAQVVGRGIVHWTQYYGAAAAPSSDREYELASERMQTMLLISLSLPGPNADADGFPDGIELPDREPIVENAAREVQQQAVWFVIEYRANERFAEEELDLTLEEWLVLSPPGWLSHLDFGAVVDRLRANDEIADQVVGVDDDGVQTLRIKAAVEMLYEEILRNWHD